jgi:K+/H+ antiporter YhaU regulatory subunit KhtT
LRSARGRQRFGCAPGNRKSRIENRKFLREVPGEQVFQILLLSAARGRLAELRQHELLELAEVRVEPGSSFAGKTLAGSQIRQAMNVIVLAIKRDRGMHFNPEPDDRIEAGDFLIAMGEPAGLRRLEESAASKIISR